MGSGEQDQTTNSWAVEEGCSVTGVAVNRWAWGLQETLGSCAAIFILEFKVPWEAFVGFSTREC